MASASSSSVSGQVWPSLVPAAERAGKPSVELARAVVLLGSETYNHIRMASSTVSRSHALILNSDGGSYIRDLVSRGGVLVNGEQVREKALFDGDEIKIGRFSFVFQAGLLPETDVTPPAGQLKIGSFVLPLNQRVVVIGRRPGCDLILENDLVSTVHAVIFTMNGKHVLRDLNSKNGTRVDGKKIHQVELKTSDVIRVGGTEIVYTTTTGARSARPAAAPAPAPAKRAAPTPQPGRAAAAAALAAASEAATAPDIDDELLPPAVAASAGAAPAAPTKSAADDFDIDELLGSDEQAAALAPAQDEEAGAAPAGSDAAERAMTQPSDQLQVNDDDLIPIEPAAAAEDAALEFSAPAPAPDARVDEAPREAGRVSPDVEAEAMPLVEEEPIPIEAEPLPIDDRADDAAAPDIAMTPAEASADVSATDDAMPFSLDDAETTTTTQDVESISAAVEPPPLPVEEPVSEAEPVVADAPRENAPLEDLDLATADTEPPTPAEENPVELARERLELTAPPTPPTPPEDAVEEAEDQVEAEPVATTPTAAADSGESLEESEALEESGRLDNEGSPALDAEEIERARNTPAAEPMSVFEVEELAAEAPADSARGGAAPEPVMSQQADAADVADVDFADTVAAEATDEIDHADTLAADAADAANEPARATIAGDVASDALALDASDEPELAATPMEVAGEAVTSAAPTTDEPAAVSATFDAEEPASAAHFEEEASPVEPLDETVTGGDAVEVPVEPEEASESLASADEFEPATIPGSAHALDMDVLATDPRDAERPVDDGAFSVLDERPAETNDVADVAAHAEQQPPAVLLTDETAQPLIGEDEAEGNDETETIAVTEAGFAAAPAEAIPTDGEAAQEDLAPADASDEAFDLVPTSAAEETEPTRDDAASDDEAIGLVEELPEEELPQFAEPVQEVSTGDAAVEATAGEESSAGDSSEAPAERPEVEPASYDRGIEVTVRDADVQRPVSPQPIFVTMSDPSTAHASPPGVFFVTVAGATVPAAAPVAPALPPRVQVVQLPLETPRPVNMLPPQPTAPTMPPPAPPRAPQNTTATMNDIGGQVAERDISRTTDYADDMDTGHEMIDEDAIGLLDEPLELQDLTLLDQGAAEALQSAPLKPVSASPPPAAKPAQPAQAPDDEELSPADVAEDISFDELLGDTTGLETRRADDYAADERPTARSDADEDAFATGRPRKEITPAKPPTVSPAADGNGAAARDAAAAKAREETRQRLRDSVSQQDSVVDVFALNADLQSPETDDPAGGGAAAEASDPIGLPEPTTLPDRQRAPAAQPGARHVPPNPAKWGPVAGAVAGSIIDAGTERHLARAPASPRKRAAWVFVVTVIAMALAALAIWKFVLPHVLVEASMPFARLAEIETNEKNNLKAEQEALLRDPQVRNVAIASLKESHPTLAPGFLDDKDALFQRLDPRWVMRDAEKMTMVVSFKGNHASDAARLGALIQAVYQDQRNQRRHRESNAAQRRLESRRDAAKRAQQEVADLKQKQRQYQELGNQRPDAAVLVTLRQTAERLEADWNKHVAERKALQAELARMQQSLSSNSAPPAADDASAAERSDSDFARMVQELEEKKRRLEELGSGLESKAAAARRELAEAVDEFQTTIKAMQEMMKDNPALNDYVASAQQLHEAAWKFQGDLIERQETQQERLVDYKRRLEEQMESRRQEIIANDPDLKELNHMLDLKQREFSAADQSGLKKEAAKVKSEIDYVNQQIEARQMMLGKDPFYSDAIKELKGIIDSVEQQLAADRERSERTMAELETNFRLRGPEVERFPQAQRSLAGSLAERATAIQQARKAYAEATAERDVDANAELKRLQSEVATLEGKVAARRNEILADLQKRMGEQQQQEIERLQARLAEAEAAEQAAIEAHSRALKSQADADALHRRWAESGTEYEALLRELPQAERRALRADEALAAEELAMKNVVKPLMPSRAEIVEASDRRRTYMLASCIGIAMVGAAYWLFTSGPRRPRSRSDRAEFDGVATVSQKGEEVAV